MFRLQTAVQLSGQPEGAELEQPYTHRLSPTIASKHAVQNACDAAHRMQARGTLFGTAWLARRCDDLHADSYFTGFLDWLTVGRAAGTFVLQPRYGLGVDDPSHCVSSSPALDVRHSHQRRQPCGEDRPNEVRESWANA